MKRFYISLFIIIAASAFLAAQGYAGEVVQGKCIELNKAQDSLTIEEYDTNFSKENPYGKPTGIIFEGNIKNAKIGISPEPGDILRIVYTLDRNSKNVLKVMNITKQGLKQK